jgi:hypothetical protein
MEQVVTAHRQLRCILWVAEAAIISVCVVIAVQIGMEAKEAKIWACAPLLIIAVLETTRVPLSGWTAHLKPFAMLCGFLIMACISVLTFEGMSMGIERFIHQRVMDVIAARDVLDAARQKAQDANELVAKQTIEVEKRRRYVADLQTQRPAAHRAAPTAQCHGIWKGKPTTYACPNKADERDSETAQKVQEEFDARLATAQASLTEAETVLKKLQSADGMTADADVLAAQKAVQEAAANSTMYRTAATWYGVPVKDLTDEQFDRFKRIAVAALAGAVSIATMMLAFISHAQPRNPAKRGALLRSIRAWVARRRKNVVRTVVKTVEKPVEKIVEVPKHIFVDRPTIVEKPVPGPERIVTHFVGVPTDPNTGLALDNGQPVASAPNLRAVGGSR